MILNNVNVIKLFRYIDLFTDDFNWGYADSRIIMPKKFYNIGPS